MSLRVFALVLGIVVSMMTTGCDLDFGDDVELSGAAFDATKLAEVSKLTGVVFPPGTRGVEYLYLGSGIDDSLAAKVVIPDDQIEAFRKRGPKHLCIFLHCIA